MKKRKFTFPKIGKYNYINLFSSLLLSCSLIFATLTLNQTQQKGIEKDNILTEIGKTNLYCSDNKKRDIQDFAYYDHYIFQLFGENYLKIIDITNIEVIYETVLESGHGGCCCFSNFFVEEGDLFPTLFIGTGNTSLPIVEYRVSLSSVQLYRKYTFDEGDVGYYAFPLFEPNSQNLFVGSYALNDFKSPHNGQNYLLFSRYNLKALNENEDSSYTPKFVSGFVIDFIPVVQGATLRDGNLYIGFGGIGVSKYGFQESVIHVIDPYMERKVASYCKFPGEISKREIQGVDFIVEKTNTKMLISTDLGYFYLVDFKDATNAYCINV